MGVIIRADVRGYTLSQNLKTYPYLTKARPTLFFVGETRQKEVGGSLSWLGGGGGGGGGVGGTGRARSDVLPFCTVCFCSCVVCVKRQIPCTFVTTDTKTRKFVKSDAASWSSNDSVVQWDRTAVCVALFFFLFLPFILYYLFFILYSLLTYTLLIFYVMQFSSAHIT